MSAQTHSITLCIIARNAEATLQSCIESAATIASQIVVIDCGSSDRTVALGRQKGALVFRTEFSSDKSAAYNLAKTQARGNWLLILEAHEHLNSFDPNLFAVLVKDQSKCYQATILKNETSILEIRFFPRVSSLYFIGQERPTIDFSVQESKTYTVCRTDLTIQSKTSASVESSTPTTIQGSWESYFHRGVEQRLAGQLEASAEFFKHASQLNPGNIFTWTNLGLIQIELEKFSEAEHALLQALEIDPNSPEALSNLGVLYLRKLELPKAEHYFRLALQSSPYSVTSYCNLAETLALMNQIQDAILVYQRALEIMPTCALAKASLGLLFMKLKRNDEAEKFLREACRDDPSMPQVHLFLGQLYCSMKRSKEALNSLERFCALEENKQGHYPPQKRQVISSVKQKCSELRRELNLAT